MKECSSRCDLMRECILWSNTIKDSSVTQYKKVPTGWNRKLGFLFLLKCFNGIEETICA